MCGLGAELAATMMEHAFDELDAPVGRLHTDPVGHPFSPGHENAVVVSVDRIISAAQAVVAGRPQIPRRLRGSSKPIPKGAKSNPHGASATHPVAADSGNKPGSASPVAAVAGVPLIMPNQDLTITEARVIQWLKRVGDPVAKDEPVVEVETDKAVMTVDSPVKGQLTEIVAPPGTVVPLGGRLGTLRAGDDAHGR